MMRKFGVLLICIVLICVLFGTSLPTFARVESSIESVEGDVNDLTNDFASFSLLFDVVELVYDEHAGELKFSYVQAEDGRYLELIDTSHNLRGEVVSTYYLGSGDTTAYSNYKNIIRPSTVLVRANNFFNGLTFGDGFLQNITSGIGYIFVTLIFLLSILVAFLFLFLDSVGVLKELVIAFFRIIGLIPV